MSFAEIVADVEAASSSRQNGGAARPWRAGRPRCRAAALRPPSSRRSMATCAMVLRKHARGNGMTLGVVGVEQAVGRNAPDHLRQLPAEIDRVLHADVEALPADGVMDMRGIAGEQHALPCDRTRPAAPHR